MNVLTCVHINDSITMYIMKISMHNAINKIINAVLKYIQVYYTCDKFKQRAHINDSITVCIIKISMHNAINKIIYAVFKYKHVINSIRAF